MSLKKYPLAFLRDIQRTFQQVRIEADKNENWVRIIYDKDFKLSISDIDFESDFFFTIQKPTITNSGISYTVSWKPQNASTNKEFSSNYNSKGDALLSIFVNWLKTVKAYSSINIHPNNNVLKAYQEKFYNSFEFLDDEYDNQPLEPTKQIQLSEFLNSLVEELESDNKIEQDIIEEIKFLNANISQLTQKQIKTSLSWCFAKMMYLGISVINNVTKVGKDAGIGYLLIEGVKKLIGS